MPIIAYGAVFVVGYASYFNREEVILWMHYSPILKLSRLLFQRRLPYWRRCAKGDGNVGKMSGAK
jgi:hypothetical protein